MLLCIGIKHIEDSSSPVSLNGETGLLLLITGIERRIYSIAD